MLRRTAVLLAFTGTLFGVASAAPVQPGPAAIRARLERWAAGTRSAVIAASPLPDGRWLAVTALPKPDLLGDRFLENAKLQVIDPAGPRAVQSIGLRGPDNHRAETGRVILPPEPEPKPDREPVLNEVQLQLRTAHGATLVILTQQIHGASWKPTQVDVYRYAEGKLRWTATAGSRGAPLLEDGDGDGNPELVTIKAVGLSLYTSHPPLWEETLEWSSTGWRRANPDFPQRYGRLLTLFAGEHDRKPHDPDLLLHLARALAAVKRDSDAVARAGDALRASAEWSHPQPDANDREEMAARIKSYFPTATLPH